MSNLTISIFRNQIFSTIVSEIKILSMFKFTHFTDLTTCINEAKNNNQLIVFFKNDSNKKEYRELLNNDIPTILIASQNIIKINFLMTL